MGGRRGEVGKISGQRRGGKKLIILSKEDVFLVHPKNGFNGLILN